MLRDAVAALNQRNFAAARGLAEQSLAIEGNAGAHYIAGIAALEQQAVLDAQAHLRRAVALAPQQPEFAAALARSLTITQDLAAALAQADRALALAPSDPRLLDTLGVVYTQCNAHDRAADAFRRACALAPDNAGYRFNLGVCLMFHGDNAGAEAELDACVRLEPRHWRAHYTLSQVRRQTVDDNHLERLQQALALAGTSPTALLYVHMAMAKELEDLGRHAESFAHLVAGKSAPRKLLGYSSERDAELFDALADAVDADEGGPGPDSDEPIFIVGMPRTGTTLVDRIVSSHSAVHSAGELHNFAVAWKRALGGPNFRMFSAADLRASRKIDWAGLGRAYVESTRPVTGHTPRFTDKLPHNFLYLGFILKALPNAKVICVRRNPLDTCLSNFRQLFAPESPYFDYSYDLLDTGRYYMAFDRLMRRWHERFPGRILDVQYEDVVDDLDASVRGILDHCGLPFEEACLRFERNSAPVTTASATQVRRPIYRSAMQRWKLYERELAPLAALFAKAGVEC